MKLQLISSFTVLNPFSTNVPLIDKPGSGFYQQNVTLPQVFLKHFASKNQLPGLSILTSAIELERFKTSSFNYVSNGMVP